MLNHTQKARTRRTVYFFPLLFGMILILGMHTDLCAAPSNVLTQGKYITLLAQKIPHSQALPPDPSAYPTEVLCATVSEKMQSAGIQMKTPLQVNAPLTRADFINITHTFLTTKPRETLIERKYFLKDKGIISPEDIGVIRSYEGMVTSIRYKSRERQNLTGYEPVLSRDTIETDENSRVKLLFDDMSELTLGEDTIVEISEMIYDPKKNSRDTLIRLARGQLRIKASKEQQSASKFEIQTPTAVIGVRGTEFLVDVNKNGKTKVITLEGLVGLRPAIQDSEGGEVMVGENSGGTVDESGETASPLEVSQEEIGQALKDTTMINPTEVENGGGVSPEEGTRVTNSPKLILAFGSEDVQPYTKPPGAAPPKDEPPVSIPEPGPREAPQKREAHNRDRDGDGHEDNEDAFPNDKNEWADTDGDGVGDNSDAYPNDSTRWLAETGYNWEELAEQGGEELTAAGIPIETILPGFATTLKNGFYNLEAQRNSDWKTYFGSAVNSNFDGLGEPQEFSDDGYSRKSLGFSFSYYGQIYDEVFVSPNGWVAPTTSGSTDYANLSRYRLHDGSTNYFLTESYGRIAPFGIDLDSRYGGEVFIQTSLDSAKWRTKWVRVPFYDSDENTENSFSLTLFSGGEIAFLYDGIDKDNDPGWGSLVIGISPGNNATGDSIDISSHSAGNPYTGGANEAIFEVFAEDYIDTFDLDYYAILFTPNNGDSSQGYTMTPFSSAQLVDPANLDEAYDRRLAANMGTESDITDKTFLPGSYEYGLQVGNYISSASYDIINSNPLLAYAVQVEEDVVNREALKKYIAYGDEKFADSTWCSRSDAWYTVNNILEYGNIRERDAQLAQIADAQAGRVLKDRNGHWLRVQQYVFRPDATTLQVVSVNLRGSGAGALAGLTVMDWRTAFTTALPSGSTILALPWADYLTTVESEAGGWRDIRNTSGYTLTSMSVEFKHGNDSLKESRTFYNTYYNWQTINSETLTVNTTTFSYDKNLESSNAYRIATEPGVAGVSYQYEFNTGATPINTAFAVVGDAHTSTNVGIISGYDNTLLGIKDIWAALSVNFADAPYIGNNNLEIIMSNHSSDSGDDLLGGVLDLVYIPLPRLEWQAPTSLSDSID